MDIHLTDDELELLFRRAGRDRRRVFQNEKDWRETWRLVKELGGRMGTCGHGQRVYIDDVGAYSSGYICHADVHGICNNGAGLNVVWDAWTPRQLEVRKRLAVLRRRRAKYDRERRAQRGY